MNRRPASRTRLARLRASLPALLLALLLAPLLAPGAARAAAATSRGAAQDAADLDRILARAAPGSPDVFLGDMGLRVDALRRSRRQLAERLAGRVGPRSSFLPGFNRWPGGDVPYAFDLNVSPANRAAFVKACGDWEAAANVHFFPRAAEADFVLVHAAAFNNSYVGRVGGPQDLNLYNFDYEFVIAHEIGHALGLIHEHQRSDRDQYITVAPQNVAQGMAGNFDVVPGSLNQGGYDFDSVMHYGATAFSANGQPTMTVNAPNAAATGVIGQHTHLSDGDKAGMVALYGPPAPATPAPTPPVPDAAPVARVLWGAQDGTLSLWDVSGAGGFTHREAGPFAGWMPRAVAAGPDGRARVLWDGAGGAASLWAVGAGGYSYANYGPYAGWAAQALAVGPDDLVRVLWDGAGGAASLWAVNADGGFSHAEYGPYPGWSARAVSVGPDGRTQMLWARADGAASLWGVNADGGFSHAEYGPYAGWSATGLASAPDGTRRVLWTHTSGRASVWRVGAANAVTHAEYGPYADWTASAVDAGADGVTRLLWAHPGGAASLWSLGGAGGFAHTDFGPYAGWSALSLGGG